MPTSYFIMKWFGSKYAGHLNSPNFQKAFPNNNVVSSVQTPSDSTHQLKFSQHQLHSGQNYLFTFPEASKWKLFYYSSRITSTLYGIESYLWAQTVVIGLVRNCGSRDTSYCVEWATLVYHSWF